MGFLAALLFAVVGLGQLALADVVAPKRECCRLAPSGLLDAASIGTRPATEVATAGRLVNHPELAGRTLPGSSHVGADFVDDLGRTFDALGTPRASQYWNQEQSLASIDSHVLKSNNFTVVDLAGFSPQQVAIVDSHIASLSTSAQATIIRLGP